MQMWTLKKIKKTRHMRGQCFSRVYDRACLVQGYCRLSCKTKGRNWALPSLKVIRGVFFFKGRDRVRQ